MRKVSPARMRAARVAAGFRKEAVAVHLGKSFAAVTSYESGQSVPPGDVLVALAELYGVPVEELCEGAPAGAR